MASKARNIADLLNASGKITADDLDIGQIGGRKNLIINGGFDVWQRGESASGTYSGYCCADRWTHRASSNIGGTNTITKQYSVSQNFNFIQYSHTSGTYNYFIQYIEGKELAGQTVTLSFKTYIQDSVDLDMRLTVYENGVALPSAIVTDTVTTTGQWITKSYTFTLPSSTTAATDNDSVRLYIAYKGVGGTDLTDGTYNFSQVQLELGSVATPFEHRSYGEELALCQRYYWKNDKQGVSYASLGIAMANGGTTALVDYHFPTTMRTSPSFSLSAAGDFILYNSTNFPVTGLAMSRATTNTADLSVTASSASFSLRDALKFQFGTNSTGYIAFDAEL